MNETEMTPHSRREVLTRSALALGALTLGGTLAGPRGARAQEAAADTETPLTAAEPAASTGTSSPAAQAATVSDIQTLNLALGIEYLLHDLYLRVAEANTPGDNKRVYIRGRLAELVPSLRDNKAAHIVTLTALIGAAGGTVVERGAFNFPADVFLSPIAFAGFAAAVEEIAAGAYLNALETLSRGEARNTSANLYGATSRHAALIRLLGGYEFAPRYFEGALTTDQVQQLIAPYRA